MKKWGLWVLMVAVVCAMLPLMTAVSEEVLLSVKDGVLYFQSYEVKLAAVEKPIRVRKETDGIVITVQTPDGEQVFSLGNVTVSVVQSAVGYVTVGGTTPAPFDTFLGRTAKPEVDLRTQDPCPLCGKSNMHGGHICPLCNKPFCDHDQNACLHIANPAETPVPTKNAEGKTVSNYVADDGSHVMGNPEGKKEVWRPDSFITPSPSPSPTGWDPSNPLG